MEITFAECVAVTDASSVGEVRRTAMGVAHRLGLDENRSGELALLATEASRNVLLHGRGGQVILTGAKTDEVPLAQILAMDGGPGIADIGRAMGDGYSTAGTMGGGLGAMKRMASGLEIFTGKTGTIVLLQVGEAPAVEGLQIGGVAVPYPGEKVCGDGWMFHRDGDRLAVLLVDGLGHGWGASDAAQEAIATFRKEAEKSPAVILGAVHDALRKTRGAVAAVAEIRLDKGTLTYAGVGNISAVLLNDGSSRSLVSYNGTLGATISRIQEFNFEWKARSVLVMHSDGVQTRWDLNAYPGLLSRHPAVIAGALLRDFRRQRDDATVVVIKGI